MTKFIAVLAVAVTLMAGCSSSVTVTQGQIDELAREISALSPDIDRDEAARAAEIGFRYGLQLSQDYNVTDSPLMHNAAVHRGIRERGLCNHYAEDMTARLVAEGFQTLDVRRAISPPKTMRIIHHTALVTPKGGSVNDGIILDPWRDGGALFWARPLDDTRYNWRPREEVLPELIEAHEKREARRARTGL